MKRTVLINKEEAKYRFLHSSFITLPIRAATEESKFNYWAIYVHTYFYHTGQGFSASMHIQITWALVGIQLFGAGGGGWAPETQGYIKLPDAAGGLSNTLQIAKR